MLTSATKKVDVAVFETIEAAKEDRGEVPDELQRHLHRRRTAASGYGKVSPRISPASWKQAVQAVRKQIASGKIKVTPQAPPATTG